MEKVTKRKMFFCRLIIFAFYAYVLSYERVQIKSYGEALLFLFGFWICYWLPSTLIRTKKTYKDYDGVLMCRTEENGDKRYKFSINIEALDNKKEFLIKYKDVED